jgi:aspartate-semialdehyde dehydrogenase
MALCPIHRRNRIGRVILASYQAASGVGAALNAGQIADQLML